MHLSAAVIVSFFLLIGTSVLGQTVISNTEIEWVLPEGEDTVGFLQEDLLYVPKDYHVAFTVSSSVKSVIVKMGLVEGSDDLLGATLSLAEDMIFEDLTSISIDGTNVNVGLGQFNGLRGFYLQLIPLNADGGVLDIINLTHD